MKNTKPIPVNFKTLHSVNSLPEGLIKNELQSVSYTISPRIEKRILAYLFQHLRKKINVQRQKLATDKETNRSKQTPAKPLSFSFGLKCCVVVLLCFRFTSVYAAGPVGIDSGIKLWLDGSDLDGDGLVEGLGEDGLDTDGSTVVTWADKSGEAAHLTVRSGMGSPIFTPVETTFFNGKGVVDFDNADVMSHKLTTDWSGDHSIFIVFNQQSVAGGFSGFFANGTGDSGLDIKYHSQISVDSAGNNFSYRSSAYEVVFEEQSNSNLKLYSMTRLGNTITTFADGSEKTIKTDAANGEFFDEYILNGNRTVNRHNDAQVAEVIIYDRVLDTCEMATLNLYLGTKYGKDFSGLASQYDEAGLSTHPYPHETDGSFSGIGAFPGSGCTPPLVSESAGTDGQIGGFWASIATPYDTDHNLDLVLSDEFTTFGYDAGGLTEVTSSAPGYEGRIERTWYVDQDDDTGTDYIDNFNINFNIAGIATDKTVNNMALLIDDDGDGDFSNARIHTEGLSITDDDNVSFTGADFPVDGAVFTIASRAISPKVTVEQAATQNDPTNVASALFTIAFSEAINTATFTVDDIDLSASTAPGVSIDSLLEVAPNDGTQFELLVSATGEGDIIPSVKTDSLLSSFDVLNYASTSIDNSVTIDQTAPTTTVTIDSISTDSGLTDFITNDNDGLDVLGTLSLALAADEILEYSNDNGVTWSDVTASVTGTAVNHTDPALTATNTVKFRVADVAGNIASEASQLVTIDLDVTATTQAVTTNPDGTLSVSGTGEPGSEVTVTFPDGTTGTAVVDASGNYGPIDSLTPQTTGDVSSTQTDTTGNVSTATTETLVDETAPVETAQTVTPNADGTIGVSGTGEPGSTVEVTFPDGTTGTAVVGADGTYGPIDSTTPQTSGTVSTTQTDEAGNTSTPTTETVADTTSPIATTQVVTTNPDGTLSVSGTGEPGSTVEVTFPDGTTGTAVVDADGSYGPIDSVAPQTSGDISTTQTDEAGNTSAPVTETVTDTTAPVATTQVVTTEPDGTLSVSGTGEPGSTVTVTFPDGTTGTAVVAADGTYGPITSALPQTSGDISTTQTDEAGNVSEATTESFEDDIAPLEPTQIITPNDDGTLSVSGTGEPGSEVEVTFPDGTTGTAVVDENGNYGPIVSEAPQTSGEVSTTQEDEAGNVSEAITGSFEDDVAPLAPTQTITSNPDGTLSVSGTGEPGSTVEVTFPDGTTGTAVVAADGTYGPIDSAEVQTTGDISTTQTDEAGNVSPTTSETLTDIVAPIAPTQTITPNDDGTLSVSGTGEPGSTVEVTFPDGTTGTAVVAADGTYGPIDSAAPQTSGDISTTQTDEAGNVSPAATETLADIIAPLAPTQTVTTNPDGTLSVSGTGEPGSTVEVTFPDGTTGTAVVDEDGNYGPIDSALPQTSGEVTTTQTDEAGNESPAAAETLADIIAPLTPTQTITPNDDGTLSVSGTGEPGSTVTVTFPDGTTGTTVVDENGNYGPITSALPQTSGDISTSQTDAAGNVSPAATETLVDIIAPLAPTQTITPNDDGTLSVSGTGEPGSTVEVTFPDGTTGTAVVDENGNYGPIDSALPQTSGDISTTQTDEAGNVSPAVTETLVDIIAPLVPTQTITPNPDGTLSVSGTGEPGSTVTVTFPDGTTGTAVVDEDGNYGPIDSAEVQTSGDISTTQTDEAGNISPAASETLADIVAPLAPTQTVTPNDDGTLSVSGTGEPGSTVTVTFPDGTTGTAVVDEDGNYGPVDSAEVQTTGEVSTTQTDEAGNVSPAFNETLEDIVAPLAPTQTVTTNDDGTLSVSGTGEPGSTVEVTFPDGTTGTAVVDEDGNYGPVDSALPQTSGEVSSTQTDEAGNTSVPLVDGLVDDTAPLAATQVVTPNPDGTLSVSGTGEPGSTVTVTFPDGTTGTAVVDEDGNYGPVVSAVPQTSGEVSTTQTDEAGNTSLPLVEALIDETPPVASTQEVTPNDDGTLSVSGTGEPGSTVTITFPDGSTGTAEVDADGNYGPIVSEERQPSGSVSTSQTDAAGNTSTAVSEAVVDDVAPTAPEVTISGSEDGTLSAEDLVDGLTIAITAPADAIAGDTLTIDTDGDGIPDHTIVLTAEQAAGGIIEITVDPAHIPGEGTLNLDIALTDISGNTSEVTTLSLAVDSVAPEMTVDIPELDAGNTPTLSGTSDEIGATVSFTVTDAEGNVQTLTAVVQADGTYSVDVPEAIATGPYTVDVSVTDAAGNKTVMSFQATMVALNTDLEDDSVLLSKSANKSQVSIGDLVYYTVNAENTTTDELNIDVRDVLPTGLKFGSSVAKLTRAGDDEIFGTSDDEISTVAASGSSTVTFGAITLQSEETVQIGYILSVGTAASQGVAVNTAQALGAGSTDDIASNIATASITIVADGALDQSTLIGKLFHDRDGDGYQDSASTTGITVKSDYFGWNSLHLGGLNGRLSVTDKPSKYQKVIRMPLSQASGMKNNFKVTTQQGTVITVDHNGQVKTAHTGMMRKGLTAQDIKVTTRRIKGIPTQTPVAAMRVPATTMDVLEITITNYGIHEEGIPGVRLATVDGLLIETDANGRYHLPDVDGGRRSMGKNIILKVDIATLPEGAQFTTENPRVLRLTGGALNKINFGIKLPVEDAYRAQAAANTAPAKQQGGVADTLAKSSMSAKSSAMVVKVDLQDDFFVANSVEIQARNRAAIDQIVASIKQHGSGQIQVISPNTQLAKLRANVIRRALHSQLGNLMGHVTVGHQ